MRSIIGEVTLPESKFLTAEQFVKKVQSELRNANIGNLVNAVKILEKTTQSSKKIMSSKSA